MVKIENEKNGHGYDVYTITTEDGTFEISFQGNLDLYWRYVCSKSISKEEPPKTFLITKENYFLFSLFETLYENIRNYHPFGEVGDNSVNKYFDELKEYEKYKEERLFKNNVIDWHSDDDPYDEATSIQIKKLNEDEFSVTFNRSKTPDIYMTYSVRFRNRGSRYGYFHIPFMTMYNGLEKYDKDNNQIHMEEYKYYQKKLIKK